MAKAEELGMTVVERVVYTNEYSENTLVEMDDALVKFDVRFVLSSTSFFCPHSFAPVPYRQSSSTR